jgi:hypothetical protein
MFAIQEPFVSAELDYRRERVLRSTRSVRVTPPPQQSVVREWLRGHSLRSHTVTTQPGVVSSS